MVSERAKRNRRPRVQGKTGRLAHEAKMQRLRAEALDHAIAGKSVRQIAAAMNCSVSTAHDYVWTAIDAIPVAQVEQKRALEEAKLDAREHRCVEAMDGLARRLADIGKAATPEMTPKDAVLAAAVALDAAARMFDGDRTLNKIAERRARLLGLDVPVKQPHELTVVKGAPTPEEAARLVREAFGEQAARTSDVTSHAEASIGAAGIGPTIPPRVELAGEEASTERAEVDLRRASDGDEPLRAERDASAHLPAWAVSEDPPGG